MRKEVITQSKELAFMVRAHVKAAAMGHKGAIRIGIPGGRSVQTIIEGILANDDDLLERVELYLVDERLEGKRNADLLLSYGLQEAIDAQRFQLSQLIVPQEGKSFLPDADAKLDLLYLGVGEDGHIASLFPGSYTHLATPATPQVVLVENSPKAPPCRVTITYQGLYEVAQEAPIYLLFLGEGKRKALKQLLAGAEVELVPAAFASQANLDVTVITDIKER